MTDEAENKPARLKLPSNKPFQVVKNVPDDAPTVLPQLEQASYEEQVRLVKGEGPAPVDPAPRPSARPRPPAKPAGKARMAKPFAAYGDVYNAQVIAMRFPDPIETAIRHYAAEQRVPETTVIARAVYDFMKRNGILPDPPAP